MMKVYLYGFALFYAGCALAYRSEVDGYGIKGAVSAYALIVSGLVCLAWDGLWR